MARPQDIINVKSCDFFQSIGKSAIVNGEVLLYNINNIKNE